MSHQSFFPVYDSEELHFLSQQNGSVVRSGKHTVSVALLSPPDSTRSSSTTSTASIDLPEHKESIEALEFFGFESQAANTLWRRHVQAMVHDVYVGFLPALISYVEEAPDELDFNAFFDHIGIAQDLRNRIMNPSYSDIRDTGSPKHWVVESILGRYAILDDAGPILRQHMGSPAQHRSGRVPHRSAPGTSPSRSSVELRSSPPISSSSSAGPAPSPRRAPGDLDTPVPTLGGHVMLWKGLTRYRTKELIGPDGNVNLERLFSSGRTDFARRGANALYFTPQKATAVKYARYAEHREWDTEGKCLVNVQISTRFLAALSHRELWYEEEGDDLWRQVVFDGRSSLCRTPQNVAAVLRHDYLIGHTSKRPLMCESMTDYRQINQAHHQFRLEADETGAERPAVQWVFLGRFEELKVEVEGKTYIEAV